MIPCLAAESSHHSCFWKHLPVQWHKGSRKKANMLRSCWLYGRGDHHYSQTKLISPGSIHYIMQPKTIVNLYLYLQRQIVIQNPAMNVQCNGKYLKMKALQLLQPHIFSHFLRICSNFTTIYTHSTKSIILFNAVGHSLAGFVWNKIYQADQILPSRAKGWCITKLHSPQTQFPASLIRSGRMF